MHIRSLVIAAGEDVAVTDINVLWVAMEMGSCRATKCNVV